MGFLSGLPGLLVVGAVPAVMYMLLVFTSAMVAMFSKKKIQRDMAWKVFNALIRRRPEPPALPPGLEDKPQK